MTDAKIHQPCSDCESSDALKINTDGSTKCYSCGKYTRPLNGSNSETLPTPSPKVVKGVTERSDAFVGGFKDRRISINAASRYGVTQTDDLTIFPYYNKTGDKQGQKVRNVDKKMWFEGEKQKSVLFGQQLFTKGGKFVTIVEGEFDALAAYQMLGNYPVVSVRTGAQGALGD